MIEARNTNFGGAGPSKPDAGIHVVELPEARLAEAAAVLAHSFRDDPNFVDLFPNEEVRVRAMVHLQRAGLWGAFGCGEIHAAIREGRIVGVAVWMPPGANPLPTRQLRAFPDTLRMMLEAPRSVARLIRFASAAKKLHPEEPHWYLQEVGVDPDVQGLGIGTRLVAPMLDRADEEGRPCYLETMTGRNVAWYRRLGFEVVEDGVPFTPGGPPNWTMHRNPEQRRKHVR